MVALLKRPRILHVITRLGVGAAARHVIESSARMMGSYDIIIAAGPEEPGEGSLRREAAHAGVPVRTVESLKRQGSLLMDRRGVRELIDLIGSLQPAIVHTHQPKAGVLGRMAARKAGVRRTVHTFHGPLERFGRDGLLRRANATAERRLARSTGRLIAVSASLKDELVSQEVVPAGRLDVILPLVEPQRLFERPAPSPLRERLGLPEDTPLVGMVGRLVAPKDPAFFVSVFSIVAASLPEARAVIAGDGPERQGMEAEAARRGIREKMTFAGWTLTPADVCPEIDVLVLTSRYEGFSLAALQTMAAGRVVAGTRVTGIVDLIDHGRTGFLADPGDAPSLAGTVILLLRDASYRAHIAAAGREEAWRRFADQDAVPRLSAVYRDLLDPAGRTGARAAASRSGATSVS